LIEAVKLDQFLEREAPLHVEFDELRDKNVGNGLTLKKCRVSPYQVASGCSRQSSRLLLIACVAPSSFAISRREGTMSMATMVVAPTARAAMIAEHPTAPAPKEAKLVPGLTFSAFTYGPGSGLNTAAEWTEAFERYVTADLITLRSLASAYVANDIARKSDHELSRHGRRV
jgi:hypothetical protein